MKKSICVFVGIFLATGVLFAGPGGGEVTSGEPVEFEFMHQAQLSQDELSLAARAEETLNVKLNYNVVSNDQLRNVVATRMAGGDLPDLYQIEDVQPYKDGLLGDLFTNITEISEELSLANVQREIAKVEERYGTLFQEPDGNYYRIPTLQTKAYGWHYIYRKDWADELGLSYDGTIESFTKFAEALGNYNDDAVGFTAGGFWFVGSAFPSAFAGEMAVDWNRPTLREKGGTWYAVETTSDFRDGLKWLNMVYEKGILDQEIFSISRDLGIQKFTTGKAGILCSNTGWEGEIKTAFEQANPDGEIGALEVAPKATNGYARGGSAGYYKSWIIGTNSEAKTSAAARFFNLFKSDEYKALMTRDEGWQTVSGTTSKHGWASILGGAYGDYSLYPEFVQIGMKNADAECVVQDPRYVEYATDLSTQYKPEVQSVMKEYIPKFITGDLDINDNGVWEEYLAECEKSGLSKLIDDIAAVYE